MAGERQKAERAARFKAAALDALDVGKGYTAGEGASRVLDGAEELATKRATAAVEAGRPLRPNERREVRRQVLGDQAGQRSAQAAKSKRPTIRERLEAMDWEARAEVVESIKDPKVKAYVARIAADVDQIEEEAEYRAAVESEERSLHNLEAEEEEFDWASASAAGEGAVEDEGDQAEDTFGAWAPSMTVEEAYGLEAPARTPSLSEEVGWDEEEDEGWEA